MRMPLKDAAQGRWKAILPALGVPMAALTGKHGPCPLCRAGTDRWRYDDLEGRGTWFCSQCGAGDGIALVMQLHACDFKGAAEKIEPLLGSAPRTEREQGPTDDEKRRWMNDLWIGSRIIRPHCPAGAYLTARTGIEQYPGCLRFHDRVAYTDLAGGKLYAPAMLAKVLDRAGKPINLHRTYLTETGEKANVADPRRMMPGSLPDGSAIRLAEVADVLGIAEGIETALAATQIHGIPCWAAVNAVTLSKWLPPAGVKKVVVFGDNDLKFAGQHAAYKLANRIAVKEGMEAEVRIPDRIGEDWNDVLLSRGPFSLDQTHHHHREAV